MVYNNSIAHIVSDLFLRRVSRFTGVKKRIATQSVRLMQILRGRDKKRRSSRASSSLNFRRPPSPPLPAEIAAMRARRMYRITFFRRCLSLILIGQMCVHLVSSSWHRRGRISDWTWNLVVFPSSSLLRGRCAGDKVKGGF